MVGNRSEGGPLQSPTPPAGGALAAPRRAAVAVLVIVIGLAASGAVLAALAFTQSGARSAIVREAPAPGAWRTTASFGPVLVERVERGPAPRAHGARHDERDQTEAVRVSVTLANRSARAVPFSPGQLRLRLDGPGTTLTATRPNPPPGAIAAGRQLRQRLTFYVPAAHTRLTLLFDDLGRTAAVPIRLGTLPGRTKE
jgi:hypothetical protein